MASEILYPVMPLFLKQIGYSAIFIGLLEGVAEAVAGLSKVYFGKKSDATGKRLPFVQMGYTLSAISKPMLALFIYPWWIFLSRMIDRLGKGIRTGARDGMLSDESIPSTRGQVLGFHRSMDTLGAVFGPAIALIYLYYNPKNFQALFLIAFIPGILAVVCTFIIKEKQKITTKLFPKIKFIAFASYWKESPSAYKKLITGLLFFALFNSSDIFLLLRMKESGLSDTEVIGVYIFYNLIYALSAYPMGILADKIGLKKIFIGGLFIFAIVYLGFSFTDNLFVFVALFSLYGLYAACTEGISKAWILNVVDSKDYATATGSYSGFQSICALLASSLCGILWYTFGSAITFTVTSIAALIVISYILSWPFWNKA